MGKSNKKVLGLAMAGVMSIGTVGSIAETVTVHAAEAELSEAVKIQNAKDKITHTIWSINNNYAGLKNQVTWLEYVKEARDLVAKISLSEKEVIAELTEQLNKLDDTIDAIARLNHVEKSYDENYRGIKNAEMWLHYLDLAKRDMASMDLSVFQAKYDELAQRYNDIEAKVQAVIDEHYVELAAVNELYKIAEASYSIADAEVALEAANKLGTHFTKDDMIKKIEDLIYDIENVVEEELVVPSSAKFNDIDAITDKNKVISLQDIMDVQMTDKDAILNGVVTTSTSGAKVRISKTDVELEESKIERNDVYLDLDGNGEYSEGDVYLGTIKAEITPESDTFLGYALSEVLGSATAGYFPEIIIKTPGGESKGGIVVKFLRNKDNRDDVLASTTFDVDTKTQQ